MQVPDEVSAQLEVLYDTERDFVSLTVVQALGHEVVGRVDASDFNPNATVELLVAARSEEGALTVSNHKDKAGRLVAKYGAAPLTRCSNDCYSYTLSEEGVMFDNPAITHTKWGMPKPHEHMLAKLIMADLSQLTGSHPERDFLSYYGFSCDSWWTRFQRHDLGGVLSEAVERVRKARAEAGRLG
jgi:hypothetical protein